MAILQSCNTPREFFAHVVTPNLIEFRGANLDVRCAYNTCISLQSYRDWILWQHDNTVWKYVGTIRGTLKKDRIDQFSEALIELHPQFEIVFHLANAAKHMFPRRSKINVNDLSLLRTDAAFDPNAFSDAFDIGQTRLVVDSDGTVEDVMTCANSVYAMWRELNTENCW